MLEQIHALPQDGRVTRMIVVLGTAAFALLTLVTM